MGNSLSSPRRLPGAEQSGITGRTSWQPLFAAALDDRSNAPILSTLHFDLRAPEFGTPAEELFAAALEMSEFADKHGFASINLSEHHGSSDGYNPSPIVLGGAIAARTRRVRISLGALIVPLHDPLRIAEDLAVLDLISRGRTVQVRPVPVQTHLPILMGGSAPVSARRAARIADGFVTHSRELYQVYFDEARRLGKSPPPFVEPGPGLVHVTHDPERDWQRSAPHALHEMNAYGRWIEQAGLQRAAYHRVSTLEGLKASGGYAVVTPNQCVELARRNRRLSFHPLMGGCPPELGWSSLRLFVDEVLPRLSER